jgi:hypothetical protein
VGFFYIVLKRLLKEKLMNSVKVLCLLAICALNLVACGASSQSALGVNCDFHGQPLRDMPLACQSR